MDTGFVLRQVKHITAPVVVCESCGKVISSLGRAWVMWPDRLKDGERIKPMILCKNNRNGCIDKPEYREFLSMELQDYLINLCRNSGLKTEEELREAFEVNELSNQV